MNAIIPRSPRLAYEYGIVQYYGAIDLHIDEFLMLTRMSLGAVAMPVTESANGTASPDSMTSNSNSLHSAAGTTMFGYYSEWSGYGTTRLAPPNERKFEYAPISWKQVEYPGPSLGYHALRPYQFT